MNAQATPMMVAVEELVDIIGGGDGVQDRRTPQLQLMGKSAPRL